jgi:outer membrane biosynthesis protein TonB
MPTKYFYHTSKEKHMEIIIGIIIVGLGYAMYRAYQPKPTVTETAVPYKVEAPAQESTPVAEPAKEVTSVTASKPARAPKAPAAVKKKPAAPKATAKKPAVKKAAPKKAAPKKAVKIVAKK